MITQPSNDRPAAYLVHDSKRVLEALRKAAEIARLRRELWRRVNAGSSKDSTDRTGNA